MTAYVNWVSNNLLLSAAIQFAVLGTAGEFISSFIRSKRLTMPFSWLELAGKIAAWGLLGIIIKYGFAGMKGFTAALLEHNFLPSFLTSGIGWAFSVSVFTNIFFGPQMMLFHRIEDNIIMRKWDFGGIQTAWRTLVWFWIPAHTVTFCLPQDYQIGLAAVWSVVLGIIMGISKRS